MLIFIEHYVILCSPYIYNILIANNSIGVFKIKKIKPLVKGTRGFFIATCPEVKYYDNG